MASSLYRDCTARAAAIQRRVTVAGYGDDPERLLVIGCGDNPSAIVTIHRRTLSGHRRDTLGRVGRFRTTACPRITQRGTSSRRPARSTFRPATSPPAQPRVTFPLRPRSAIFPLTLPTRAGPMAP